MALSLLSGAAPAAAFHVPWYAQAGGPDSDCTPIAGVYSFVETVNSYDNSKVGTVAETAQCSGGVGLFVVTPDCSWQWKRIRNDPDDTCETDSGWEGTGIRVDQQEFWTVSPAGAVGSEVAEIVFSVQSVAGAGGNSARRLVGSIQATSGCALSFSGWATGRDGLTECDAKTGRVKRSARLTSSSSSSVSVSDIKDALALIAAALPDWETATSSDSSSSSDSGGAVPCGDIAGVYQIVETVNEYDASEVVFSGAGLAQCNGGVAFLDIHPGCGWAYKKVSVGEAVESFTAPIYRCEDDAGAGIFGVVEHETEFCRINRNANDNLGTDFKFAVENLQGSSATFIHGIMETVRSDAVAGPGCDVSFEGWRVARQELTPCKDRCYSSSNGDFSEGYFNFDSELGQSLTLGNVNESAIAITTNPKKLNALFANLPCQGLCLVASTDALSLAPVLVQGVTVLWGQFYQHLGDTTCCPSSSYTFSFDAANVGKGTAADTFQVGARANGGTFLAVPIKGAAGNVVTPVEGAFTTYTSEIFLWTALTPGAGAELAIVFDTTTGNDVSMPPAEVLNAFAFDNFRVQCAGVTGIALV